MRPHTHRVCHIVPFHNAVAYSMARWTCRSFPYISTVFATALQKLTAENAARSASFLLASRAMPLLRSSGSPLVAQSAKRSHRLLPWRVCVRDGENARFLFDALSFYWTRNSVPCSRATAFRRATGSCGGKGGERRKAELFLFFCRFAAVMVFFLTYFTKKWIFFDSCSFSAVDFFRIVPIINYYDNVLLKNFS